MGREKEFGELSDDAKLGELWDTVSNLSVFKQANAGKAVPRPENWESTSRSLAGVLDGVFKYFAARESPEHGFFTKTPHSACLHENRSWPRLATVGRSDYHL